MSDRWSVSMLNGRPRRYTLNAPTASLIARHSFQSWNIVVPEVEVSYSSMPPDVPDHPPFVDSVLHQHPVPMRQSGG